MPHLNVLFGFVCFNDSTKCHLNVLGFLCVSSCLFHSPEVTKGEEDVPPAESCVVVPACNQAAEEKSSVSEYFSCVSSVRKLVPVDECGKKNKQVGSEYGEEVKLSCLAQALLI